MGQFDTCVCAVRAMPAGIGEFSPVGRMGIGEVVEGFEWDKGGC